MPSNFGRGVAVPVGRVEHLEDDLPLGGFHRLLQRAIAHRLDADRAGGDQAAGQVVQAGSCSPLPRSTARSITFCNSRTLPGQR